MAPPSPPFETEKNRHAAHPSEDPFSRGGFFRRGRSPLPPLPRRRTGESPCDDLLGIVRVFFSSEGRKSLLPSARRPLFLFLSLDLQGPSRFLFGRAAHTSQSFLPPIATYREVDPVRASYMPFPFFDCVFFQPIFSPPFHFPPSRGTAFSSL